MDNSANRGSLLQVLDMTQFLFVAETAKKCQRSFLHTSIVDFTAHST